MLKKCHVYDDDSRRDFALAATSPARSARPRWPRWTVRRSALGAQLLMRPVERCPRGGGVSGTGRVHSGGTKNRALGVEKSALRRSENRARANLVILIGHDNNKLTSFTARVQERP